MLAVLTTAATHPHTITSAPDLQRYARTIALALGLGALWFVCCRHLSGEWRYNDQYSYGWFVPFFAAYLLWLRWEDRPAAAADGAHGGTQKAAAIGLTVVPALLLLPLRVFEIGSSDWRPLGWLHALIVIVITLALIYLVRGPRWARHFAFPLLFFLTAVPWITAIEGPLTQNLMRVIAAVAAETVSLVFGIPAEALGNVVQLPNGLVGVNEACSGVRSFQTSIMIGLLFGELKRLAWPSRLMLVGGAVGIALFANFLRVVFLVWIASTQAISAVDKWHDPAGYGILVLVFAGTMWMAGRFGSSPRENETRRSVPRAAVQAFRPGSPVVSLALFLLLWSIAVEVGAEGWYRMHERNLITAVPWTVRWPENEPGYRELEIDERSREMLRYDEGREATWRSKDLSALEMVYMFFFRWNPGAGTILRARAHRPDICLPSAGWQQIGRDRVQLFPLSDGRLLPFRHFAFVNDSVAERPVRADAYFCLHEDRVHAAEATSADTPGMFSNWDLADRWRVVKSGIRNLGQQVLQVMIVTPAHADDHPPDDEFGALLKQVVTTAAK